MNVRFQNPDNAGQYIEVAGVENPVHAMQIVMELATIVQSQMVPPEILKKATECAHAFAEKVISEEKNGSDTDATIDEWLKSQGL
jgi:hypothetical protein